MSYNLWNQVKNMIIIIDGSEYISANDDSDKEDFDNEVGINSKQVNLIMMPQMIQSNIDRI